MSKLKKKDSNSLSLRDKIFLWGVVIVGLCICLAIFLFFYSRYTEIVRSVQSYPQVDNVSHFVHEFTLEKKSSIPPKSINNDMILSNPQLFSPFPPCTQLRSDATLQENHQLFPEYHVRVFYDDFWGVFWLELQPKSEMTKEYFGPYRVSDTYPGFIEYIKELKTVVENANPLWWSTNSAEECMKSL